MSNPFGDVFGASASGAGGLNDAQAAMLAAIKAKTDTLGTASVSVQSPVATDGQVLALRRGDDYRLADGRQLDFTFTNCPTLTGATVSLLIGHATISGAAMGANAARFELTRFQTSALPYAAPNPVYSIRATLADGNVVTLANGGYQVR